MKKIRFSVFVFFSMFLISAAVHAQTATRESVSAAAKILPAQVVRHYSFKPDASYVSYFLAGNIHDTLGYVRSMQGRASASIATDGSLTEATVEFTCAAKDMKSNDDARDKRMYKKFMEIHLYPEIIFKGRSVEASLQATGPLSSATKEQPLAFELTGPLSIHGTTRDVTIPVTAYPDSGLLITEGSTTLQLPDFNIKNPSWLFMRTEDTVKIEFHVELQPLE